MRSVEGEKNYHLKNFGTPIVTVWYCDHRVLYEKMVMYVCRERMRGSRRLAVGEGIAGQNASQVVK